MSSKETVNWQMSYSVCTGQLQLVEELIDKYGLSYCDEWSSGYILLQALKYGHTEVAKLLLKRGTEICWKDKKADETSFDYAINNGDAEIVELLLKKYVHSDLHLSKFLHHPVENGNIEIVKVLLHYGADVNISSERGDAPLHIATEKNNIEMVLLLLSNQADVNVRNNCSSTNVTPLHIASACGYIEIVKVLLNHGASMDSINYKNYTPLHCAVFEEHKDVVELLLNHGAKVDSDDNNSETILHLAVKTKNIELVEIVLKHLPDVDKENNQNALITALCSYEKGYEAIVETLLEYGYVIRSEDAKNFELLHRVIEHGYLNVVNDLIKFGADVNMSFRQRYGHKKLSPLYTAVVNNRIEIFQTLIKHGANVKLNNDLLHIAVGKDFLDMVHLLLLNDIDVNAENEYGKTPLHIAIGEGIQNQNNDNDIKGMIVELLLSKGANVNTRTEYQGTVLMTASKNGNIKAVKALLEYGADVNAKQMGQKYETRPERIVLRENLPGQTSLHLASDKGHSEVVKILIENGADVNIINSLGHTPVEYGARRSEITRIFQQQFVRIQTANLHLSLRNKHYTYYFDPCPLTVGPLNTFHNQCLEEISRMKETKVSESNISFYDILTKDNNESATYMNNDCIVETLRSGCYKEMFPIYRYMIQNNFKKAYEIKQLMEQCVDVFPILIHQELPLECVGKIFSFLSNDELNNLI